MQASGYEIRVRNRLGPPVAFALRDLDPSFGDDVTILHLDRTDQPSLHGTLRRLSDLGVEIIGLERVDRAS